MANVLIGYGNVADRLILDPAVGSWVSTMPLGNLQTRPLGVVARSTDLSLASTRFQGLMPPHNPVTVLALANHNFALDAKHRLRYGADPGFTTCDYDSGWQPVWPSVYHTMDLHWEDSNWWDGRYTEDERAGYMWTLTQKLASQSYATYWRWEFDDRNNASSYIQAGRLFAAKSWQPAYNMDYGATLGWQDDSGVQAAISGAEFFDDKVPYRVATLKTEFMAEDAAMSGPFEITRRSKVTKEVLFMWDPDDTLHATRRQFLGRLRSLSPLEFPEGFLQGSHITSMGWEVKELQA